MNAMLSSSLPMAEVERRSKNFMEACAAAFPESRLTMAERRSRTLRKFFRVLSPLRRLYSIAADPLSVGSNDLEALLSDAQQAVMVNDMLVARSVSAAKFSKLLQTSSMLDLLAGFLEPIELEALRNSAYARVPTS